MASSVIGALRVVLGLDSAQFESGINRASRTAKTFEKSTFDAASAVRGLGAALGIASVGVAAREFLSLSDQSKQLAAQLKLATAETGNFGKAQEDVRRIATTTRTGLKEVADLYGVFQRNSRELGITQEESARATETITKAFRVSGATAQEAAGGLRQFLQGIQSGTLRGEELNSVLENAPRLARALADGLGITIGQLRVMGQEGKLTGQAVLRALRDAATGIDREFSQLPVTFDEAMTQIHNAAIITFGAFDRGGEFSTALANFISGGTEGFADLEAAAETFGRNTRAELDALAATFGPVIARAQELLGLFQDINSQGPMFGKLFGEIDAISRWAGKNGLTNIGMFVSNPGAFAVSARTGGQRQGTNLQTPYLNTYNQTQASSKARAGERWVQEKGLTLDWLMGNNASQKRAPARPAPASGSGGKSGGRKGPSAETLAKRAEAESRRAAEAMRRFADDLARDQAHLTSSLAELSRSIEQRADAEINELEVRRQINARAIDADRSLNDQQRQQAKLLNDQNAEAEKNLVRQRLADDIAARNARIEQDRADLAIELLGHSRELARTAIQAREVELRIVDLAFEAERARLEQIKATNAVASAEYQYAEARLRELPNLRAAAQFSARQSTQGPLEAYLDKLPRSAEEAREALERVQTDGIQGIVDGLAEAAVGARSLGDVFKNVAKQIIADLIRIQMQRAIVGALGSALGIGGGFNAGKAISDANNVVNSGISNFKLPGFATGGSFRVGGPAGIDNTLVAFKASRGEMVDIRRPGSDRRGPINFDLRGAVMTADLVAQMNQIGQATGMGGAMAGAKLAEGRIMSRSRRRIPG